MKCIYFLSIWSCYSKNSDNNAVFIRIIVPFNPIQLNLKVPRIYVDAILIFYACFCITDQLHNFSIYELMWYHSKSWRNSKYMIDWRLSGDQQILRLVLSKLFLGVGPRTNLWGTPQLKAKQISPSFSNLESEQL